MTSEQLDELERLARAATPGPWEAFDNHIVRPAVGAVEVDTGNPMIGDSSNDTAYIAATNPKTVLALIERVRELERLLTWTNEELGCPGQEPVDEFEFGHYCPSCDSSIDRNMELRKAIRAALTPKGASDE